MNLGQPPPPDLDHQQLRAALGEQTTEPRLDREDQRVVTQARARAQHRRLQLDGPNQAARPSWGFTQTPRPSRRRSRAPVPNPCFEPVGVTGFTTGCEVPPERLGIAQLRDDGRLGLELGRSWAVRREPGPGELKHRDELLDHATATAPGRAGDRDQAHAPSRERARGPKQILGRPGRVEKAK